MQLVDKYLDREAIRLVTGGPAETAYCLTHRPPSEHDAMIADKHNS